MAKVFLHNISFRKGNCTFNIANMAMDVPDDQVPGVECPIVSRTLDWPGAFEAIELETSINLEYHEGDENRIMVSGPENWIDNLALEVRHHSLRVADKPTNLCGCYASQPKLIVYHRGLKELKMNRSGAVTVYGGPALDALSISSSGSVRLEDGIDTKALSIRIQGSGNVFIPSGRIRRLLVNIIGSGNVTGSDIFCLDTEIQVTGSGFVSLTGETDRLTASQTGSGVIRIGDYKAAIGSVSATGGLVECRVANLSRMSMGSGRIVNQIW